MREPAPWRRAFDEHQSLLSWWRSTTSRAGGAVLLADANVEDNLRGLSTEAKAAFADAMEILRRAENAAPEEQVIAHAAFEERASAAISQVGLQTSAVDDQEGCERHAAEEALHLAQSPTWYIAEDLLDLVEQAAAHMPVERVLREDMPSSQGFVWFPRPWWHGERPSDDDPQPSGQPLRALHWHPTGRHDVQVVCYRGRDDIAPWEEPPKTDEHAEVPCLWPATVFSWDFGDDSYETAAADSQVAQLLKALWTISAQSIAQSETVAVDRPSRRRAQRAGMLETGVRVITLRRTHRPVAEDQVVRRVEWTHRWVVRGHWRNQWLPSTKSHRLQYIVEHIKGPDDKPLMLKHDIVNVAR